MYLKFLNHRVPSDIYAAILELSDKDMTVQYSTVQYSTVQYSTVQYSTVQYSTVCTYIQYVRFVYRATSSS